MSRPYKEQLTIENLTEERDELAKKIMSGRYEWSDVKNFLQVVDSLKEFNVDSSESYSLRAAVKVIDPRWYDLRIDGIGAAVTELKTGRRGIVESIEETSPDWIEPLVRWSDGELSRARSRLLLSAEVDDE